MNSCNRSVDGFFSGLMSKNESMVKKNTQMTWLFKNENLEIVSILPSITSFKVKSKIMILPGAYDFEIIINGKEIISARVLREVAPYKPDPTGENGQWGVNPFSIINSLNSI